MKNICEENFQAVYAAAHEEKITPSDIAEEMLPLVEEYFLGKTNMCGGGLQIEFFNGQKFILSATEL